MYERYREIRDSKGLRDADVASGTGMSKSVFSEWKSGRSTPKTEKLAKIADFLGVDIRSIIGGGSTVNVPLDLNDLVRNNRHALELLGYLLAGTESDWEYVLTTFKMLRERDRVAPAPVQTPSVADLQILDNMSEDDLEEEYKKRRSNSASNGTSYASSGIEETEANDDKSLTA